MIERKYFDELIKKRRNWVYCSKENKFDFESILSGFYNDPSHFIYEILQNAEDAGAKEISFNLLEDQLIIVHNGKDFDFNDVDGITGIGISNKKDDINAIGKFGVGFKSVFAISQSPEIKSGSYHFMIDDFVVPTTISEKGITGKTNISLPFNHSKRSNDEIFNLVERKLKYIGLKTLLFLSNIDKIKWTSPSQSGHYYKSYENLNVANAKNVSIYYKKDTQKDSQEIIEEYLVIQRLIEIENKKLRVEIAYKIDIDENNNREIVPVSHQESKLVVYFPTEKETYLNFIIQGPYKTTSNREDIPLSDEQNQFIIEETANLVADSISIVKKLVYLNTDFFNVLPIYDEYCQQKIYLKVYDKVKEKFLSEEKLLPTFHGGFSNTSDSLLARGKDLPKLLNQKDIKLLFNKSHWLNKNITEYGQTKKLREYLIRELKVKEIDFKDFAENITEAFMKQKSDKWIIQFYRKLLEQQPLWREGTRWQSAGILRNKPIIRLKKNKHIPPFNYSGKIQVYLPVKTKSKYNTVKPSITKNANALKFLKALGVTKPDIFSEIREYILPKYSQNKIEIKDDEYFNDIKKLLVAFNEGSSEKKNDLISELSDLFIINSQNLFTGEKDLMKPNDVYLKKDELNEYFKGYENVYFVSDEIYKNFKSKKLDEFLLEIGCEDVPKRVEIDPDLTMEDKRELRGITGHTSDIYTKNYDYEGLMNYLSELSMERSVLLWNLLLKSLSNFNGWDKSKFFYGEYSWFYFKPHTKPFKSKFLKILKTTNWLFGKDGNQVNPELISVFELADEYPKNDKNIDVIVEALGFKLDEIKKIEEKTGGKFIPKEDVEEYEEFKKIKANQSLQDEENEWSPEVEPEDININVEEIDPNIITTQDYRGQEPQKSKTKEPPEKNEGDDVIAQRSTKKITDIGKWGERYVLKHLNEKFEDEKGIEIKWLNQNGEVGKGYDFSIISNSIEVEYIEVKSKIYEKPQLFEITGTQWEFSRKLFNDGEGNKYKIYIVSGAGTKSAKIRILKNPTKLWIDGKLYAHPVYFRL